MWKKWLSKSSSIFLLEELSQLRVFTAKKMCPWSWVSNVLYLPCRDSRAAQQRKDAFYHCRSGNGEHNLSSVSIWPPYFVVSPEQGLRSWACAIFHHLVTKDNPDAACVKLSGFTQPNRATSKPLIYLKKQGVSPAKLTTQQGCLMSWALLSALKTVKSCSPFCTLGSVTDTPALNPLQGDITAWDKTRQW